MEHAPFIWTAYGLSAVVLAWAAIAPLLRRRKALNNLSLIERTERNDDDTHP